MRGRYAHLFRSQRRFCGCVMHGNIRILTTCVSIFCVVIVESEFIQVITPEIDKYNVVNEVKFFGNNTGEGKQVGSIVYQTVNKYYCSLDSIIEGSHLMVYGTKGWTFPLQDVNLTLRYPPEERASDYFEYVLNGETFTEDEEYVITGFKVILYIDGPTSEGFITDGGVLLDTITLSFVSSQLTHLSYEFWLYGARKDTPGVVELNSHYRLC